MYELGQARGHTQVKEALPTIYNSPLLLVFIPYIPSIAHLILSPALGRRMPPLQKMH